MPDAASAPIITFLSDYGLQDDFVGICHGVMARSCPSARVIDLTHGIPRHDVRAGAIVLSEALAYLPAGVHLAVVDPDVGAQRRAIALRLADGRLLVGPDNGLLSPAAAAGGGVAEAVDIARSGYRLQPVSATFHGRDIFAPVAAALAAGVAPADAGEPLDPETIVSLELPQPTRDGDALVAHVRYIDRFGNLQLDAGHEHLTDAGLKLGRPALVELADGTSHPVHFVRTFADAGRDELLLYEDAQRRLAIAVRHGDAAALLGLTVDAELRIRPG
ncbi:MAG TPA: SAM-dependent chlorinase/fluorinase [Solirubrobacteraceae bacterium]|nr:SAM-dependent chlorinase/fluorinase [Solirubrobacteraceae bacterium]